MANTYCYDEERSSGIGKRILALVLGILFGIILTIGSIAGVGYYLFARMKIKDGFEKVNDIGHLELDYSAFLTDEYAEKTVAELLKSITDTVNELKSEEGSLATLEKISPLVRDRVEQLVDSIRSDYSIDLDADALIGTPFRQLGNFVRDSLETAELGTLLRLNEIEDGQERNELLMLICYGEEGVDYSVSDGKVVPLEGGKPFATVGELLNGNVDDLLGTVSVATLFDTFTEGEPDLSSAMTRAIRYGVEGEAFEYDEANNEIVWKELTYEFSSDGTQIKGSNGKKYVFDAESSLWKAQSGKGYISEQAPTPGGIAAVAASEESDGFFYLYDEKGELVYSLSPLTPTKFAAIDENGEIQYNKPPTVADLTEILQDKDSLFALFDNIPLSDILDIDSSDPLMMQIVFGTEGKNYAYDESGNIVMLPVAYRMTEEGFFNDDGAKLTEGTDYSETAPGSGIYRIFLKEGDYTVVYFAKSDSENPAVYYLYDSENPEERLYYKETTFYMLQSSPENLLGGLELGKIFDVSPLDENPNKILVALAYGNEGEHYEIKTNGDGEKYIAWKIDPATGDKYAARKVSDLQGENCETLVKSLSLSAVIEEKPNDAVTMYLLYGVENVHYVYSEATGVVMLQKRIAVSEETMTAYDEHGNPLSGTLTRSGDGFVYDENGTVFLLREKWTDESGDVTTEAEEGGVKKSLPCYRVCDENGNAVYYKSRTIGDMTGADSPVQNVTKDLTIGQLIGNVGEDSPKIMQAVKDWKIEDLNDESKIDSLELGSIIRIDGTSAVILQNLANSPVGELSEAIDGLTLTQILGEESVEGNYILKHLTSSTVHTLASDIEGLTVQQVFENDVYQKDENGNFTTDAEGNRILTGTWKYLLSEPDAVTGELKEVRDLKISEISRLVDNMTTNIQGAALNDLYADGIIHLNDPTFLTQSVTYHYTVMGQVIFDIDPAAFGNKTYVGELTISQLIEYVSKVLTALN